MMNTQEQNQIIPMDLSEIISIITSSGGEFSPLSFFITQPSTDTTKIHVNIQACDPDSISVDVSNDKISINANVILEIKTNHLVTLSRSVATHIPLAPGVNPSKIHALIKDNTLTFTIPLE